MTALSYIKGIRKQSGPGGQYRGRLGRSRLWDEGITTKKLVNVTVPARGKRARGVVVLLFIFSF